MVVIRQRRVSPVTFAVVLLGLVAAGTPVSAQTPPEVCALDSLYLLSPAADGMRVTLSRTGRFGAVVQWVPPADDISTCAALIDTAGLGIAMSVEGDYRDDFDRIFKFTTTNGGVVGSTVEHGPRFDWANQNQEQTGRVIGAINLGNDGGVFGLDAAGQWQHYNDGLPAYLSRVDVLVMAAAPGVPGRLAVYIEDHQSRGVWLRPSADEPWRRIAPDLFRDGQPVTEAITALAFSPEDPQTLVVGTIDRGLFVSHDGGETFTQHRDDIEATGLWDRRRVTVLHWRQGDQLLVGINDLGLYVSTDGGDSYQPLTGLRVPQFFPIGGDLVAPEVLSLLDLGGGRVLAGVARFGLYQTTDGGINWTRIWRDQDPENPVPVDVSAILVDETDPQVIWMGTASQGLWRSSDGGTSWNLEDVDGIDTDASLQILALLRDPGQDRYVAVVTGGTLLSRPLGGTAWSADLSGPGIQTLVTAAAGSVDGFHLWLATRGGGIYEPGTPIRLSDTIIDAQTDPEYQDFDFGLELVFGPGEIALDPATQDRSFSLVMQDFQGYAVWRASVADPHQMELIGLYDKNNPETCIEGYCGDESVHIVPGCFHEKRAACFDFSDPDTARFFDGDIFDGFVYYYAVTTFDYGNTALANPQSLTADMLFSPRFLGDDLSPFPGEGNIVQFRVNLPADDEAPAEEVYVVPNPLRLTSSGLATAIRGEEVMFKNLPPQSHVQVFTVDGDLIADLGPERQEGRNMSWITRNEDGQLLASGVYIYRVEVSGRDDYYGKLVIIR